MLLPVRENACWSSKDLSKPCVCRAVTSVWSCELLETTVRVYLRGLLCALQRCYKIPGERTSVKRPLEQRLVSDGQCAVGRGVYLPRSSESEQAERDS